MNINDTEVVLKILNLLNQTGYDLIQKNGQRHYGPPPDWPQNMKPPKNCEVFVGRIPRDCFEDELVPLFSSIGRIYKLRLMMTFEGINRGFAYVKYTNQSDANRAVQLLDKFMIRANHRIGVVHSLDNSRLFVGNLPANLSQQRVLDVMSAATPGVVSVVLLYNTDKQMPNNGFAFIDYKTHRAAAMARRKLLPNASETYKLFGTQIAIDWAIPEPTGDQQIMSKVTVLYVRYLNNTTTDEMIRDFFSFKNQFNIIRVKRIKNFAFVHYETRSEAELAFNRISAMDLRVCPLGEMRGQPLEVKWSIPPDMAKRNSLKSEANKCQMSLNPMASPFRPSSDSHSKSTDRWNRCLNSKNCEELPIGSKQNFLFDFNLNSQLRMSPNLIEL